MNLMTSFGIMFYPILFNGFCDWWLCLKLFIHWGIARLKSCKSTQLQSLLWSQHSRRKVGWKEVWWSAGDIIFLKHFVYLSSEKNCQGVSQPRYSCGQAFISRIFGSSKSGCIPSTSSSNQVTKVDIHQNQQYVGRLPKDTIPKDTKWDSAVLT